MSPEVQQDPLLTQQIDPPSRLLALPAEIQLLIFGFAVIEAEPLYLNCPCDSSFGGWTDEYYDTRGLWEVGERQPPQQPGLTRVCTQIRADTLPMFYQLNQFQAGYCYECDLDIVLAYLKFIGTENRKMMKSFYFFDGNRRHDANRPTDLKRVMRSAVTRQMGGRVQSSYDDKGCTHAVTFDQEDGREFEGVEKLFL